MWDKIIGSQSVVQYVHICVPCGLHSVANFTQTLGPDGRGRRLVVEGGGGGERVWGGCATNKRHAVLVLPPSLPPPPPPPPQGQPTVGRTAAEYVFIYAATAGFHFGGPSGVINME